MPLMPMPPIPAKCRCWGRKNISLSYCFGSRAQLSIEIVHAIRAPPPPESPPRAAPRPAWRSCRAASPMRSSAPGSRGQFRISRETASRRSSPRRAPGGPRRRAPWPPRCASDDRRRRRETAPGSRACRRRPVPRRRPRPTRQTTRSAAAKAAGMSVMNGTTSPSSPTARTRVAQLFAIARARSDG